MKSLALVIILSVCAGCATPSREAMATADYGPYPTDYEQQIKQVIEPTLRDPWSAHYQFTAPQKGWAGGNALVTIKTRYGWIVGVSVNAKNGFGGYTGWKQYSFLVTGGQVLDISTCIMTGLNPTAGFADQP
jgi:hypothetical protein